MGSRRDIVAWRWLFITEGAIPIFSCRFRRLIFSHTPETAWLLTEQEKALIRACKRRDIVYKDQDEFESKWNKEALRDLFIYLGTICFFIVDCYLWIWYISTNNH